MESSSADGNGESPFLCGALMQLEYVLEEATSRCGSCMGDDIVDDRAEDDMNESSLRDRGLSSSTGLIERGRQRGQRVQELGDRTSSLNAAALDYRDRAAQLKNRMKKKKWYEL